jgi:hypothetical protein
MRGKAVVASCCHKYIPYDALPNANIGGAASHFAPDGNFAIEASSE